jgi:hypothetical protein
MTDDTLRQALAYAARGWPVFPCQPGHKIPATTYGYHDATTDEQQITTWFGCGQRRNLAIATGAPGPDVLDVDEHGPAGNGYEALAWVREAGMLDGAAAFVATPRGRRTPDHRRPRDPGSRPAARRRARLPDRERARQCAQTTRAHHSALLSRTASRQEDRAGVETGPGRSRGADAVARRTHWTFRPICMQLRTFTHSAVGNYASSHALT